MSQTGTPKALWRKLPLAVRELLADEPRRLTEAEEISTLKSADVQLRATFRLAFDDGSQVKGRVLYSRPTVEFLAATLPLLPREHFPQILKSSPRGLFEEWVDGNRLDANSAATCLAAGRLLGRLHQTSLPGCTGNRSAFCYRAWFEANLYQAIAGETLSVSEARRIHQFALPQLPKAATFVLAHRDLCPENLLWRDDRLCSIDNVSLASRARAEDLARTWCRWPMATEQRQSFLAGYREFDDPGEFLAAPDFWIGFALVNTLAVRSRITGSASAAPTREVLLRYLDDPESLVPRQPAAA